MSESWEPCFVFFPECCSPRATLMTTWPCCWRRSGCSSLETASWAKAPPCSRISTTTWSLWRSCWTLRPTSSTPVSEHRLVCGIHYFISWKAQMGQLGVNCLPKGHLWDEGVIIERQVLLFYVNTQIYLGVYPGPWIKPDTFQSHVSYFMFFIPFNFNSHHFYNMHHYTCISIGLKYWLFS